MPVKMTRDDVLLAVLRENEETGCVPPPYWVAELFDVDASAVRRWYRALVDEGVLWQPYDRGPYAVVTKKNEAGATIRRLNLRPISYE